MIFTEEKTGIWQFVRGTFGIMWREERVKATELLGQRLDEPPLFLTSHNEWIMPEQMAGKGF